MAKFQLVMLLLCMQMLSAYTWHNYLNRQEKIYNYCEVEGFGSVLCTEKGIVNANNQLYSYGSLPVKDATSYKQDTLLLIQGDGLSYSDGLYKMSKTGNFEVVWFSLGLRFIAKNPLDNQYYLGRSDGLLTSTNGLKWHYIPFFSGKDCRKMVFHGSKAAVMIKTAVTVSNVYWSDDSCLNWSLAGNGPVANYATDIDFNSQGDLIRMLSVGSFSDGMYAYTPASDWWDLLFWGCFKANTMLPGDKKYWVGWLNGQGIARYLPSEDFDDGLPNLSVNKIKFFTQINTPTIICCTDSGAYYLTDYTSINAAPVSPTIQLSAYPNPFNSTTNIRYSLRSDSRVDLRVFNSRGELVYSYDAGIVESGNHSFQLKTTGWSSGVYICRLFTNYRQVDTIKLIYCR